MADFLQNALNAMKIIYDEPITLPNDPRFRVFDENKCSLLGRLLNPEAQSMYRMIDFMPGHWKVSGRVRGIALSRDKFQFIFDREEDLQMVLDERPVSFSHWTMLLERWEESPPDDFLTKFEVWVRIRNIPCNYYTMETMDTLARAVGKVIEVAYDPKASQKTDFIRAKVLFDVAKPALEEKKLNLPTGESVVISYEFEKLRKKCYHCYQLTHDKNHCPLLSKQAAGSSARPSCSQDTFASEGSSYMVGKEKQRPVLDGPPGFPPLFPELSGEKRNMALQYISHADESERRVQIQRIQQAIEEEKASEAYHVPRFTTDLHKEKGMVLVYGENQSGLISIKSKLPTETVSAPLKNNGKDTEEASSDHSSSSPLSTKSTTVFHVGSSDYGFDSGTSGTQRKRRGRPPAWQCRLRSKPITRQDNDGKSGTIVPAVGSSKRKAETSSIGLTKKANTSNINRPVDSVLKPLPPQ